MPQPQSKETQRMKRIKWYVKSGYNANKIQKMLSKSGWGVRRKVLLGEIRIIKKQKITMEKRVIHIPRKYRKKEVLLPEPEKQISIEMYRMSFIISDVPVHSRSFRRNYIGFRLQAFSSNKTLLINNQRELKKKLIELTNEYLHSDIEGWSGYDCYIGTEPPTLISTMNIVVLNNRWIFKVERDGTELFEKSGFI